MLVATLLLPLCIVSVVKDIQTSARLTTLTLKEQNRTPAWAVRMELQWRKNSAMPGGIQIYNWKATGFTSGGTVQSLTHQLGLNAGNKTIPKTLNTQSNYLIVIHRISQARWCPDGNIQLKNGRIQRGIGYHQVAVKYALYYSAEKSFSIKVTSLRGKKITDIGLTQKSIVTVHV